MTAPIAPPSATDVDVDLPDEDGPGLRPAPASDHAGCMIALYPPPEIAQDLEQPGGTPFEDMHVTVAYAGPAELVDVRALRRIAEQVSTWPPITAQVSGVARFAGGKDGDVLVALVDSADLEQLRRAVVDELVTAGVEVPRDHGYTAHITLGYLDPDAPTPIDRLAPRDVTFRDVSSVHADDRVDVALTGARVDGVPEGKSAAGTRFTRDALPADGWNAYRKTQPVRAVRVDGPFVVETREGVIASSDGWLAVDSAGWPYPIAAAEFDAIYEPLAGPPAPEAKAAPGGPPIKAGAFAALGERRGRVDLVVTKGTVPGATTPDGDTPVEGSASSPAARVVEYEEAGGGLWKATGEKFAAAVGRLKRVAPLRTREAKSVDEALAELAAGGDTDRAPAAAVLRAVYERGEASWPGEAKTTLTAQQWALGRAAAFCGAALGDRPAGYVRDDDLLPTR